MHQHNHLIDELRWVVGGNQEKKREGRIGEVIEQRVIAKGEVVLVSKRGRRFELERLHQYSHLIDELRCLVGGSEEKRLQERIGEMIRKTVIGWVWGKGHQFDPGTLHQHSHLIDELGCLVWETEEEMPQGRIEEVIQQGMIGKGGIEQVWGKGHQFGQEPLHQHNHLIGGLRWVIGGSEEKRLQGRIGEMIRKTVIGWVWGKGHQSDQRPLHQHNRLIDELRRAIGGSEEKRLQGRIGEMIRKTVIGAEVEWVIGGNEEKRLQGRIGEMIRKTVIGWVWGKEHQSDQRPLHQHNRLIDELRWVIGGSEEKR